MTATEGTVRLCKALYGREPTMDDWKGGANARMLHDAADRIEGMKRASLLDILIATCEDNNTSLNWVRSKSRKDHIVRTRVDYIIRAHRAGYTHEQIAELINRDRSTVSEHIKNHYQ